MLLSQFLLQFLVFPKDKRAKKTKLDLLREDMIEKGEEKDEEEVEEKLDLKPPPPKTVAAAAVEEGEDDEMEGEIYNSDHEAEDKGTGVSFSLH